MVSIIIPTYNEKENIQLLIEQIFQLNIPNLLLVVADDNSPDGTGDVADVLSKKYPIYVIHRPRKMGLGTAYIQAFRHAIASGPDYVIHMDADLSHDPAAIPRFLEEIKKCDVVLGSRYVAGGKIENWGFARKLISKFGNLYARLVLSLPYKDLTGGYKCFRREVLERIDLENLSSRGYNFQIETTYYAHTRGYKICEIPIVFKERKKGQSKFNIAIIVESFFKVLLLRLR
jgi:dolichol-phosphate mannosyltransferase